MREMFKEVLHEVFELLEENRMEDAGIKYMQQVSAFSDDTDIDLEVLNGFIFAAYPEKEVQIILAVKDVVVLLPRYSDVCKLMRINYCDNAKELLDKLKEEHEMRCIEYQEKQIWSGDESTSANKKVSTRKPTLILKVGNMLSREAKQKYQKEMEEMWGCKVLILDQGRYELIGMVEAGEYQ